MNTVEITVMKSRDIGIESIYFSSKILGCKSDMTGGDRRNYGRNLSRAVLSTALGRAKFMKDRSNMRTGETNPIVYWTDGSCLRAK